MIQLETMRTINWKNATPEQINFWNNCNGLIAWNTLTPLSYSGPVAGSEFLAYLGTKLYMGLELCIEGTAGIAASLAYTYHYDMANAIKGCISWNMFSWDVTAAAFRYVPNTVNVKNVWFSRILTSGITYISFNGYRLTIV